jgi:hypothetical protein
MRKTHLYAELEFKTPAEMLDEIIVLRSALRLIARKKKMDAVAAVSMRAIATTALSPSDQPSPTVQRGTEA